MNDLNVLAKAFDDALWGKPGEMFFWDPSHGGKMPKAVKYPWNKDDKGNFGPARPEGQFWGGGNMDVRDFMDLNENRSKLRQLTGSAKNPNKVPYPVEGKEIVPWSEYMDVEEIPENKDLWCVWCVLCYTR